MKWNDGQVNSQNTVASDVTSLASVWHTHDGCVDCPNALLVVYQDSSSQSRKFDKLGMEVACLERQRSHRFRNVFGSNVASELNNQCVTI